MLFLHARSAEKRLQRGGMKNALAKYLRRTEGMAEMKTYKLLAHIAIASLHDDANHSSTIAVGPSKFQKRIAGRSAAIWGLRIQRVLDFSASDRIWTSCSSRSAGARRISELRSECQLWLAATHACR